MGCLVVRWRRLVRVRRVGLRLVWLLRVVHAGLVLLILRVLVLLVLVVRLVLAVRRVVLPVRVWRLRHGEATQTTTRTSDFGCSARRRGSTVGRSVSVGRCLMPPSRQSAPSPAGRPRSLSLSLLPAHRLQLCSSSRRAATFSDCMR